jgi:hypothetical protein
MSTRCNLKITADDPKQPTLYLYRHWDGYLSETGKDIAEKLISLCAKDNSPAEAVRVWCLRKYEATTPQVAMRFLGDINPAEEHHGARSSYELTDAAHGDIEYFYHIHIQADGELRIGYAIGYGPGLERKCGKGPLDTFIGYVNDDIDETNKRIDALKTEQPGAYGDCEHIEAVSP